MLKGKTVVLGVSGGIAAYKIANLASMLSKQHADVHVIMTENATNFIHPTTFETLTGHKCLIDTFDRNFQYDVKHIALAKAADVVLVAPATANVIAKFAHGIADDMLTTTVLACRCKKIIAPAMNTAMYENLITQDNIKKLKEYDFTVIEPAVGMLACKDVGAGKMPECEELFDYVVQEIGFTKDYAGKKVVVTAGATKEAIDPVRYITNHSTGKMGYALAKAAALRGAEVVLVSGAAQVEPYRFVDCVQVESAEEMFQMVKKYAAEADVVIKAAAVADYRPKEVSAQKIKKQDGDGSIVLERTTDILAYLGEHRRPGQKLCGFSMETEHMLENSTAKLERKKVDMIVANHLRTQGAGFGTDTNVVTLITKSGVEELPLMSKDEVSHRVLDAICTL